MKWNNPYTIARAVLFGLLLLGLTCLAIWHDTREPSNQSTIIKIDGDKGSKSLVVTDSTYHFKGDLPIPPFIVVDGDTLKPSSYQEGGKDTDTEWLIDTTITSKNSQTHIVIDKDGNDISVTQQGTSNKSEIIIK